MLRIGLGYDLHKLVAGRKLILGGVEMESDFGSLAHSDGDALIHALVDSFLSPIGAPDIGTLFPDSSESNHGISSLEILRSIKEKYLLDVEILSLDAVVILDRPKIAPYLTEMKQTLARILEISEGRIGIKGKTSENTKPSSVECYVVSLLEVKNKG
jgi:2-C-methyl-D-erythritol 2,4-cyclodiphosphate synthase